ncbi:hypothetical protein [uncultured Clostridium sp.]|uniref:hypothetical protein n=1 Tax=uncultured Clostridium sp. TaxID=59620 RepID=UPI00258C3D5A|nr:hypothetical protein [uncultured Clostridium sp.]
MGKIYKNRILYLFCLGYLCLLGLLSCDHVNINGLQEVLKFLINLDTTTIFCAVVGIEALIYLFDDRWR